MLQVVLNRALLGLNVYCRGEDRRGKWSRHHSLTQTDLWWKWKAANQMPLASCQTELIHDLYVKLGLLGIAPYASAPPVAFWWESPPWIWVLFYGKASLWRSEVLVGEQLPNPSLSSPFHLIPPPPWDYFLDLVTAEEEVVLYYRLLQNHLL